MADAKWIKVAIEMFNDPKLKIINSMEEKDLINYVWMRSLLLAGRSNMNGCLYINENMPYTMKTLAIEFDRAFEDVKLAFKVLKKLEMIEVTQDRIFRVKNWAKHQNIDELEKLKKQNCERVAKHRAKKKELEESNKNKDSTEIDINKDNSKSEIINAQNGNKTHEEIKGLKDDNDINPNDVVCNDNSNITYNAHNEECNITVMEQNKKKIKKENKNKEIERDNDDNTPSCNDEISSEAIELIQYCENITGIMGTLNMGALNLAISIHGKDYVKKAIDKAIETGKVNMRYINGILRNWRKEGYPEDDVGGINNGAKSDGKSSRADSNEFKGIKPKKCRELTEEERKNIESDLI